MSTRYVWGKYNIGSVSNRISMGLSNSSYNNPIYIPNLKCSWSTSLAPSTLGYIVCDVSTTVYMAFGESYTIKNNKLYLESIYKTDSFNSGNSDPTYGFYLSGYKVRHSSTKPSSSYRMYGAVSLTPIDSNTPLDFIADCGYPDYYYRDATQMYEGGGATVGVSTLEFENNNTLGEFNAIFAIGVNSAPTKTTVGRNLTRYAITLQEGAGTLINNVSGDTSTLYPNNDISGSYWYTYKGSDNIDPTAITYPSSIKGGQSITLTTTKSSGIKYGGTITYTYEVQLNGGNWTSIGDSTSLTKSYTVPKGTITFRARVKARDNLGFTSTTYKTGSQVTVINNVAPVISGSNQNLGVFTYNPPVISYVVTDENNDTVTVTVKLDSSTLESRTVTLGQTYTVSLDWWNIGTGSHTIAITANDGNGGTATRTYTFTKNSVGQISFNRLHKKTDSSYQTTYIETDSDSIITNNGQILSERLTDIASKLSTTIDTAPIEMVSRHRLHIKLTSEYTIDYLEMYSTNIKVGSSTLEEILVLLESKIGISNGGTVPSDLNFERWRMKNSSGGYDIIYLEGISEHIIRPCGKTVEESLQAIESKL